MSTVYLGQLLHGYFEDYLKCQKGVRASTIKSYRDAISLFLEHLATAVGKKLSRVPVTDLTCAQVTAFLQSLEDQRKNCVRTRNHRLAVVRTFFEYVLHQAPEAACEAQRIATLPAKRTPPPQMRYMDRDEVEKLFSSMPREGHAAQRDRALVLFLYNTGARVQEVADLCWKHVELESVPIVHLHGKGDKWRTCPLWKATAQLLRELASRVPHDPATAIFLSRRGGGLTRFGIYKMVRKHTAMLNQPSARPQRRVSPHCFRHTTAVHLLEAGVEPNVIRGWLGHVGMETTNRYAEITLRMKQKALETCEGPLGTNASLAKTGWREDADLVKWLKSL
jgi:site-specific recombinase XerD